MCARSDHRLADARDALAFDDSPYSGSLSLHQQVLIDSSTPSTSALSGSLPQPLTTLAALGSPFTLNCKLNFDRQPSAAPDWQPCNPSGSLRQPTQPSAAYAAFSSPQQSPPAHILSPSIRHHVPSPHSAKHRSLTWKKSSMTQASESSSTQGLYF